MTGKRTIGWRRKRQSRASSCWKMITGSCRWQSRQKWPWSETLRRHPDTRGRDPLSWIRRSWIPRWMWSRISRWSWRALHQGITEQVRRIRHWREKRRSWRKKRMWYCSTSDWMRSPNPKVWIAPIWSCRKARSGSCRWSQMPIPMW